MSGNDLLYIAFLIVANGFFVAAEFALVKVRTSEIDLLVEGGSRLARFTSQALERLDAYLSASQLGITVASLALGQSIEHAIKPAVDAMLGGLGVGTAPRGAIGLTLGSTVALMIGTFLHMALGEQAPKSLAIRYARPVALWTAPVLVAFTWAFWPVIWLLNTASNLVLRLVGLGRPDHKELVHTEEELRHILGESEGGGALSRREREMIENVLNLEEKNARRVMVPRPDVVYLSLARPLEDNLRLVRQSGHTRYPVCEDDLTNVIGMVHVKDLYRATGASAGRPDLRKLSRKVPLLPEALSLDKLLREFQVHRVHLAMLLDEYGSVVGMATLEGVLEELVGPIDDEFDQEDPRIKKLDDGAFAVDAACPLDDLQLRCDVPVPETEAETAGGLILDLLGRLARVGDAVTIGHSRLTVIEATPTRIRKIRVETIARPGDRDGDDGEPDAGDPDRPPPRPRARAARPDDDE
jgi:CBS domain containing-hemolysin-like protein